MNNNPSTIGFFSSFLFAAACASGGTAERSETGLAANKGTAASESHLARRSCTASNTSIAPSNGLIADFGQAPGGISSKIATFVSPESPTNSAPTYTTSGGKLSIQANTAPGAKPQFLTTTLQFDGCIDASGFTGIEFTISGSFSGCSLVYASVDPEHQYLGPGGHFPPQKSIAAADMTATPRQIKAPFSGSDIQGNPATPVDASKLAFVLWQFIIPVAPDDGSTVPPCTASIAIDDVRLYR